MSALATVPRGTVDDVPAADRIHSLPVEFIDVGPNVRVTVAGIEELAASVAEHGVIQPIKVRHAEDGAGYVVTWGQRRLLASKMAGRTEIPAIIDDTSRTPSELAIEQLVENLAREDVPALDRARAMRLVVDAGVTQADLARELGLGASTVANDLRLLDASPAVHEALEKGQITASHAKALLPLPVSDQEYFVKRVASGGLSTHRLEEEVGWKLQTLRGEELRAERATKQTPKLLAALEAANVSKDTLVAIRTPYNLDQGRLEPAVTKAGWKLVARGTYARERGPASKCDCAVVVVELNRSWKVEPACIDDRHRDRQNNVNHVAEEKRRKAVAERVAVLAGLVEKSLVATPMHPVVLRLAYRRRSHAHEWTELAAMPDAEVARLFAINIADGIDPTYAYQDQAGAEKALEDAIAALAGEAETPA